MKFNGGIIGRNNTPDGFNAPGVWSIRSVNHQEYDGNWIYFYPPLDPFTYTFDFESGSFASEWTKTDNFSITSSPSRGSYSAGSSNNTIDAVLDLENIVQGGRVDEFEFYWWEDSGQSGFTVELLDYKDDPVLYAGGNNPQWELRGANGDINPYGGDGYNRWILFQFTFDWDNGTFDWFMQDTSSDSTASGSNEPMINSTNLEKFRINASIYGSASYMYVDDIKLTKN